MTLPGFQKLKDGLKKTRDKISGGIRGLISGRALDDATIEELEECLIAADVSPKLAGTLVADAREYFKSQKARTPEEVIAMLRDDLKKRLSRRPIGVAVAAEKPTVVLVCGVNGSGKTTSIAKLANHFRQNGNTVVLAACDTFRAAAVEQLAIWGERIGVDVVRQQTGSDPAAVAFDAAEAAVGRKADVLIVDTAGRLHTQKPLMLELEKIKRVIGRRIPGAPHETLLVLDATTGQNAIVQARQFGAVVTVTGLFLAKLDGTAKGGVVLSIVDELEIPVKFTGIGETCDDIQIFSPDDFVDAIFNVE